MLGPHRGSCRCAENRRPFEEQLELVHRNALRLLKLVDALLDFSSIEAGRMRASFRPVEAAALTDELVGTSTMPAGERG